MLLISVGTPFLTSFVSLKYIPVRYDEEMVATAEEPYYIPVTRMRIYNGLAALRIFRK